MNILINQFTNNDTIKVPLPHFGVLKSEEQLIFAEDVLKLWKKRKDEKLVDIVVSYGAEQAIGSGRVDLILYEMEPVHGGEPYLSLATPEQVPGLVESTVGPNCFVEKYSWKNFSCNYFSNSTSVKKFVHIPDVQISIQTL